MSSTESPQEPAACSTPDCNKPGSMACPTCIKLGLPPSRYCAQASVGTTHALMYEYGMYDARVLYLGL